MSLQREDNICLYSNSLSILVIDNLFDGKNKSISLDISTEDSMSDLEKIVQ